MMCGESPAAESRWEREGGRGKGGPLHVRALFGMSGRVSVAGLCSDHRLRACQLYRNGSLIVPTPFSKRQERPSLLLVGEDGVERPLPLPSGLDPSGPGPGFRR